MTLPLSSFFTTYSTKLLSRLMSTTLGIAPEDELKQHDKKSVYLIE